MDYIEWCELVLTRFADAGETNQMIRDHGIYSDGIEKIVWSEEYNRIKEETRNAKLPYLVDDALYDLRELGLVSERSSDRFRLTLDGSRFSRNFSDIYLAVCSEFMPDPQSAALEVIGKLSAKDGIDYAQAVTVENWEINEALQDNYPQYRRFTDGEFAEILKYLRSRTLIFCEWGDYPDEVRINLRGLIWLKKRSEVLDYREVDELLEEWETTNVDFKRQLRLDKADEKAEFIKDVIGLANTKTSGQRWIIIGFDDKTRELHIEEDASITPWYVRITQDRVEQIISEYIQPNIVARYSLVDYRNGKVGKLEVVRKARDLPYEVSKSIGDKKRIVAGSVFVRHGSHTVQPDLSELQDLRNEAARSKQ